MAESVISLAQATFTPSEAETITGVSQATQRDWRRRELTSFRTRKGRKRFTTDDLAHLLVMDQLLPHIRPAVAYHLARLACHGAMTLLAGAYYPRKNIKVDGEDIDPAQVERFAIYCRWMDGRQARFFSTSDLNNMPYQQLSAPYQWLSSKTQIAFYVVVDLTQIADRLRQRSIKPYFIPDGQGK
jgi:hypothetical protein